MPHIQKILCPSDFDPASDEALGQALWLAERFGASITLLHVWELPGELHPEWYVHAAGEPSKPVEEWVRERAERHLERLHERVGHRGVQVTAQLEQGDPAREILRHAANHDLIVMGTHGRRGVRRLLIGSVAEVVVRRAKCPVMTVHAPPKEKEEAHDI